MAGIVGSDKTSFKKETDGCLLDLDINTSGDVSAIIPGNLLPQLFQELAQLGQQIVQKGDAL